MSTPTWTGSTAHSRAEFPSAANTAAIHSFTECRAAVWEYNLVLAASAVGAATIGAGKLSLDYALFHTTGLYDLLHGWWAC